jgi:hypothetical protein
VATGPGSMHAVWLAGAPGIRSHHPLLEGRVEHRAKHPTPVRAVQSFEERFDLNTSLPMRV